MESSDCPFVNTVVQPAVSIITRRCFVTRVFARTSLLTFTTTMTTEAAAIVSRYCGTRWPYFCVSRERWPTEGLALPSRIHEDPGSNSDGESEMIKYVNIYSVSLYFFRVGLCVCWPNKRILWTRQCGDVSRFATKSPQYSSFIFIHQMAQLCRAANIVSSVKWPEDLGLQTFCDKSCSNWCHLVDW